MDPFTALTGAAGLASLGITICNGILTYCHNYRSRSDDLVVLNQLAARLKSFLQLLEERQRGSVALHPTLESSIQECLSACGLCKTEFNTFHDKYSQQPATSSLKSHGKSVVRKLQYPFERDKFESLRHQLNEFHFALSAQILVMNYDLTTDLRRDALSESSKLALAIATQGRDLSGQVSGVARHVTRSVNDRMTRLEDLLHNRLESLQNGIEISFKSHQKEIAKRTFSPVSLELDKPVLEAPTLRLSPMSREFVPGAVVSSCPRDSSNMQKYSRSLPQDILLGFKCPCAQAIRSIETTVSHRSPCICSFSSQQKKRAFIGQIRLFNFLFAYEIAIKYSPSGYSRDFQVYPNFSVRTVHDSSPAFDSFERAMDIVPAETANNLAEKLDTCLFQLYEMFMSRRASPPDVDRFGYNLVDMALIQLVRYCHRNDMIPVVMQYVKRIIAMGTPVSSNCMQIFLGCFESNISTLSMPMLLKELLDLGAEIYPGPHPFSQIGFVGNMRSFRWKIMGFPIPSEYGVLSRALLEQSEPNTRRILSTSKCSVLEKGPRGETPLHFSCAWAKGINLLLEEGGDIARALIDSKDYLGKTPLSYSCYLGNLDSIRLLLDADASINLENTANIESCKVEGYSTPTWLSWPSWHNSDQVVSLLCHRLASRRKEFVSFALSWLSNDETSRYHLHEHKIVQEEAFEICSALRHRFIPIPWNFQSIQPGSIYHSPVMSAPLAEALFQAGFDHSSVTYDGFSPLMTVNLYDLGFRRGVDGLLNLVDWFVKHGADINSPIPLVACGSGHALEIESGSFKAIHRIACAIGRTTRWGHGRALSESNIDLLRKILTNPTADHCRCYCAQQGCSPVSLFTRGIFRHICIPIASARLDSVIRFVAPPRLSGFERVLSAENNSTLTAMDFIRVITFTALGMKHTCCEHLFWSNSDAHIIQSIFNGECKSLLLVDSEDIEEIQGEDQYLAIELDRLMEEFEVKFHELGQTLGKFLGGYWFSRMQEIEAEAEDFQAEDIEAIQEIGVVLEGSNSQVRCS